MKLRLLPWGVAIAVCASTQLSAQTLTTWNDPVNVTASPGSLTKSGGCDGCPDAGAFSATQLNGDGYAEFVPAAGQRLFGGLGNDLTASTSSSTINYAFSIWPNGTFEIRELGVYKADGTFAPGDTFRVAVETGVVVYRKNGVLVYTSAVPPVYPLVLDTSLYSLGASLSGATVVPGSTTAPPPPPPPPPSPPPPPTGGPVRTATSPYLAVTDRNAYTKPALPVLGPANSTFTDPVFQSQMARITDNLTRPGTPDESYRTPSSPHQNEWSANDTYFYVVSTDGTVIPLKFNPTTRTAQRIQPATTGAGGLVLNFYIEPQFSYVTDSVIYGSVSGGDLLTIDQYDFSTGVYTNILDLQTILSGLAGTYIGGIASSAGSTERIIVMFGGAAQDHHHYVLVFDRNNPANRLVLDTTANTLNGAPTSSVLSFSLHHAAIDRSGRYVMLYPTSADQIGPRQAPQSVAWDTQTGSFTAMPVAAHPYGHDSFGYGVSVNQDCCITSAYDGVQWQFRNLSTPLSSRDVLPQVLLPQEVYISDHSTWHNAQSGALVPLISALFRYGTNNTTPWRALDDEIVAVETDVPGANPTIWRFAHHRSNVADDTNAANTSFWYEPRPNVSHDGQWVLFTSNWEKTLGTDPGGDTGSTARQDVFLVQLEAATGGTPPPPPPPPSVVPVAISTSSLPAGYVTVSYTATLQASGGSGTYAWSVTGGALPAGLTLSATSGAISGTPTAAGTYNVTISAADAANVGTATFQISITTGVKITSPRTIPPATHGVYYSYQITAANIVGTAKWSLASGSLPPGITLNATTGVISGTCSATGMWHFNARVTDVSSSNTLTLSLKVQ